MKIRFAFILVVLFSVLLISCNRSSTHNVEFYDSYTNWIPVDPDRSFVFSDTLGNSVTFYWNYYNKTNHLVYIEGDEGCTCYYYADQIEVNYLDDSKDVYLLYKYYIEKNYGMQTDMLEIDFVDFKMRINIPYYDDDYNYSEYADYLFASKIILNGQTFHNIYYRQSLDGYTSVYYKKGIGVVAFMYDGKLYVLNQ